METIQVPRNVKQALRRIAEERGLTLGEALVELVIDASDPGERSRAYIEAAHELIAQAGRELEEGSYRQASEKIWGAAALAIKAHAYSSEKKRLASHSELWQYKSKIAEELGEWIHDAWAQANAMHTNFYERWADKQSIQKALDSVEKLIEAIYQKVTNKNP
ncbi:MAG: PaREP1 family protein [Aigarchaeota archaeon]|nr:PaREP1 family protein [Candidatus Pelearchaeum maunauluense]